MDFGAKSDVGKVRSINQDNYLVLDDDLKLLAVADGMGGHKAGEVASGMAIQTIRQFQGQTEDVRQTLNELILTADQEIYERQKDDSECEGMGTTLTIGIIKENLLYIGHVGDSRAYLFRNHNFIQLTTDHSLVNELLKQEQITEEEAQHHPQKHLILQALGSGNKLNVEINCFSLERSDIILLCSDGLTDLLTDQELIQILENDDTLQEKCDRLIDAANANGGKDNITVILYRPQLAE